MILGFIDVFSAVGFSFCLFSFSIHSDAEESPKQIISLSCHFLKATLLTPFLSNFTKSRANRKNSNNSYSSCI